MGSYLTNSVGSWFFMPNLSSRKGHEEEGDAMSVCVGGKAGLAKGKPLGEPQLCLWTTHSHTSAIPIFRGIPRKVVNTLNFSGFIPELGREIFI